MSDSHTYPLSPEQIISPRPLSVPALKTALGLTIDEFAAATGRSPRSAARWIAAEAAQPATGDAARP